MKVFIICLTVCFLFLVHVITANGQVLQLPYSLKEKLNERAFDIRSTVTIPYSVVKGKTEVKEMQKSEIRPSYYLGSSYYDLHTNSSSPEKIVYTKKDDKDYLQMIWMSDANPNGPKSGFPERRTYYELFELSSTFVPSPILGTIGNVSPLSSEASLRTGWPSIDKFSDGNVAIFSHNLNNKPLNCHVSKNLGSEFQTNDVNSADMSNAGWPHIAICGNDFIHSLQAYNSSFGGGTKSNFVTYTQSKDQGNTFGVLDENDVQQPEITISRIDKMDSYSIDARGNVVVIMFTLGIYETYYMKSVDNGKTFSEFKLIFSSPEQKLHQVATIPFTDNHIWVISDTFYIPGSNMDVIVDNDGVAHFVFAPNLVSKNGRRILNSSTGLLERIPGYSDTIFTVEPSATIENIPNPSIMTTLGMWYSMEGDTAPNGLLNKYPCGIPSGTGWNGSHSIMQYQLHNNLCKYPNFAIDEDNSLYVVYSSFKNDDVKTINLYRSNLPQPLTDTTVSALNEHIYITQKKPGDFAWSIPVDLTADGVDCSFSTLCNDVVNNNLYLGYTMDSIPGCYINSTINNWGLLDVSENKIMLSWVNSSELNESTPGKGVPVSVHENGNPKKQVIENNSLQIQLSPNPVSNQATLDFNVATLGVATIEVYSMTGEKVANVMNRFVTEGDHSVQFSTLALPVGSYRISLKHNNTVSTVGMTVVR